MKKHLKTLGRLTALILICSSPAGCANSGEQNSQPASSETVTTVAEESTTATTTEKVTTKRTEPKTEPSTTTTALQKTKARRIFPMPFNDISSAEVVITNGEIYPYYFTPSPEVQQALAETLSKADWSEYDFGSPEHTYDHNAYDALGIINVRNNDEYIFLELFRDNHIMVKKPNEAATYYQVSEKITSALYDSFYSNEQNGNELQLYGGDIYSKDFWDHKWSFEPQNINSAPCGDISNAYVGIMDTAIATMVYVPSEIQLKMLSDVLNSGEWVELPDDAQPPIYGNTSAMDVYINNNGSCCSLYIDMYYISYYDGTTTKKYSDPGNVYSTARNIMGSVVMDLGRNRMIGTKLHSGPIEEETADVIWEEIWGPVLPAIEENTPKWNSRELDP